MNTEAPAVEAKPIAIALSKSQMAAIIETLKQRGFRIFNPDESAEWPEQIKAFAEEEDLCCFDPDSESESRQAVLDIDEADNLRQALEYTQYNESFRIAPIVGNDMTNADEDAMEQFKELQKKYGYRLGDKLRELNEQP